MKVNVYSQSGKEKGTVEVSDVVFGAKWNEALVSQVVRGMQANARTPVAHAKDRSEVRGGGRKPWKQKGTGRARHGSTRSPIWVGGGKAHGPVKMRDYSQKINKTMRAKALFAALSEKAREGKIIFVDSLAFSAPKTKDAIGFLAALGKNKEYKGMDERRNSGVLIAISGTLGNIAKSFQNMGNVEVVETLSLNPVSVLKYKYVLITEPEVASAALEKRITKSN
jgi:large subunit ribosomal protein L4